MTGALSKIEKIKEETGVGKAKKTKCPQDQSKVCKELLVVVDGAIKEMQ
ncbi:MAG: hypothetical protein JWO30_1841 [Fibrobacteres bacterium]|nr:hypothetical protein [Fibrobacterota bacterium]